MNVQAILAAHRRKALERIAAREKESTKPLKEDHRDIAPITKLDVIKPLNGRSQGTEPGDSSNVSQSRIALESVEPNVQAPLRNIAAGVSDLSQSTSPERSLIDLCDGDGAKLQPVGSHKPLMEPLLLYSSISAVKHRSPLPGLDHREPGLELVSRTDRSIPSNSAGIVAPQKDEPEGRCILGPEKQYDTKHEQQVSSLDSKKRDRSIASSVEFGQDSVLDVESDNTSDSDGEVDKLMSYISLNGNYSILPGNPSSSEVHLEEYRTAPIFSQAINSYLSDSLKIPPETGSTTDRPQTDSTSPFFTQYGLLGFSQGIGLGGTNRYAARDKQKLSKGRLIFANVEAPWSAFVCGSQGAGKSHTLSCLLENALLSGSGFNKLPNPLSGIVFHYDKFTGRSSTQLCEAAFLCSAGIEVTILVSPSNIWNMKEMYTNLPGLPTNTVRPKVLPLYLTDQNLTMSTIMKLMAADSKGSSVPLYISVVHSILQEMAMQGSGTGRFSYTEFKRRVQGYSWLGGQRGPLDMRLRLLEAFLTPSELTRTTRPAPAEENIWAFRAGSLTIVDLSDSFVDENDACALFSICLSIFMESRAKTGQIIALDEAHKFLTQSGEAKALTEDLTSIIRQQRHTGTRVIIATQEPTLSPKLMELANVTIVHRFLSPNWYNTIKHHLAAATKYDKGGQNSLFETIVALETGEALLFCPTALLTVQKALGRGRINRLGNDFVKIKIRKRQTTDGGRSILASETVDETSAATAISVPMYVVTNPPPLQATSGAVRPRVSGSQTHQTPPKTASPAQPTAAPIDVHILRAAVNGFVSTKFHSGWHSPGNIGWWQLHTGVESALGVPEGTVSQSGFYKRICAETAINQINRCRYEKGWAEL